jgi:hypothetical protein
VRGCLTPVPVECLTETVVLDCGTVPYIDVTAARMLNRLTADLQRHGVRPVLAGEIGTGTQPGTRHRQPPAEEK